MKNSRFKFLIIISLFLSLFLDIGCSNPEDNLKTHIINHSDLIDPHSVKFRNLKYEEKYGETIWCGEINSKNRMGGYVGWSNFYVEISGGKFDMYINEKTNPEIDEIMNEVIDIKCSGTKPIGKSNFWNF